MHMMSGPIPVTYKPHTDCEKREVQVPEGYEIHPEGTIFAITNQLMELNGLWAPLKHGAPHGTLVICHIAKPFKVDGPGWYKQRDGGWIKNPPMENNHHNYYWYENGRWYPSEEHPNDLIAKATPQQAALLDTL